jgi:hypothetical protein
LTFVVQAQLRKDDIVMTTNKSTKTFAYGIATGAAAIGVLAGSVLTATSASAAAISWGQFGTPDPNTGEFISLFAGDKKSYVLLRGST